MMLPVKNSYEVRSSILSSLYIYKTHILYIGKEKVILNFCRNYTKCTAATVLKYPIILFKLKQQLHQNLGRLSSNMFVVVSVHCVAGLSLKYKLVACSDPGRKVVRLNLCTLNWETLCFLALQQIHSAKCGTSN